MGPPEDRGAVNLTQQSSHEDRGAVNLTQQSSHALLASYFQARRLFGDLDFSAMTETHLDELFAAWLYLSDRQRNEMDAEFREIFELSCEKGFRAIIDEAEWHLANGPQARTGFVEKLAALANHFERAVVTFLDYNQFWKGATRFYHADTLPYWRKRKNLPHLPAVVDNRRKLKLENDRLTSSLSMARQRSRPPWASIARSRS